MSCFHHAAFEVAWTHFSVGMVNVHKLGLFKTAIESLVQCVTRLYDDPRHPQLLDLYHMLAEITQHDLETQRRYLEFERAVLRRYYPAESNRQDAEIMSLVQ